MKTVLTAVLLGAALISQQVQARTIHLGSLSDGSTPYFFDSFRGTHVIDDLVTFKLTSLSDITGEFFTVGIQGFKLSLDSTSFSQTLSGGPIGACGYSFNNLTAGTYTLDIRGFTPGRGGSYLSAFNVSAVPEADTWMMIMIGIGLVGLQLHRKQKGIERGPLRPADNVLRRLI